MLIRGNTGQEEVIQSILRDEFVTIFTSLKPEFIAQARKAYLNHFTAADLEAMADFMESPVGMKLSRETPAINSEMFSFGQNIGRAAVMGAMPRIIARMRAASLNIPTGT